MLHLIVAPCATAMMLMPASADCEHCQTSNSPDAYAVASAATGATIESVALDSGPSFHATQPFLLFPEALPVPLSGIVATIERSHDLTTRHGDPPLYLLLGQLRI